MARMADPKLIPLVRANQSASNRSLRYGGAECTSTISKTAAIHCSEASGLNRLT
jgi:hypothetical protein